MNHNPGIEIVQSQNFLTDSGAQRYRANLRQQAGKYVAVGHHLHSVLVCACVMCSPLPSVQYAKHDTGTKDKSEIHVFKRRMRMSKFGSILTTETITSRCPSMTSLRWYGQHGLHGERPLVIQTTCFIM